MLNVEVLSDKQKMQLHKTLDDTKRTPEKWWWQSWLNFVTRDENWWQVVSLRRLYWDQRCLVDERLDISCQGVLAAQKANCSLGSI